MKNPDVHGSPSRPPSALAHGLAAASLLLPLLWFGGCAGKESAPAGGGLIGQSNGQDIYRVTAETSPFYHYGPQQSSGPDLSLKKETRVIMLQRSYGYSQVRTADNQTGYVGTEDLAPLTASEIQAERDFETALRSAQKPPPGSSGGGGGYSIPPEAGNQEQLPMPAIQPTPNPALFRF